MLSKKHRLPGYLIPSLLNSPHSLSTPFFLLKTLPNPLLFPRFGVIVSSKIVSKAHQRNQLKRLLKNLILKNLPQFPSQDFIFIARHSLKNQTLKSLQPIFKTHPLSRLSLHEKTNS